MKANWPCKTRTCETEVGVSVGSVVKFGCWHRYILEVTLRVLACSGSCNCMVVSRDAPIQLVCNLAILYHCSLFSQITNLHTSRSGTHGSHFCELTWDQKCRCTKKTKSQVRDPTQWMQRTAETGLFLFCFSTLTKKPLKPLQCGPSHHGQYSIHKVIICILDQCISINEDYNDAKYMYHMSPL